jgi:hypothetical protein
MPNLVFYALPHFGGGLQTFTTCHLGPHGTFCHINILLTGSYQYHIKNNRGKICGHYVQKFFPLPSLTSGVVIVCVDVYVGGNM